MKKRARRELFGLLFGTSATTTHEITLDARVYGEDTVDVRGDPIFG